MRTRVLIGAGVTLALWAVMASPALAKWTFGNGASDINVNTLPSPAASNSVCTTDITGQAGVHTSTLPAPTTGLPQSFTVDVYTGPAASLDGSFFVSNGLQLQDGTVITPVGSDTTGPAQAIDPLQNQYVDFNNDPLYEYAAAPFDVTLAVGKIAVGNEVLVAQSDHTAYATFTAVDCGTTPPPITATIDILPGVASNPVIPSLRLPLLPVRIYGSAALDVTSISSVKLGDASQVAIPKALAGLFAPHDRNGDG